MSDSLDFVNRSCNTSRPELLNGLRLQNQTFTYLLRKAKVPFQLQNGGERYWVCSRTNQERNMQTVVTKKKGKKTTRKQTKLDPVLEVLFEEYRQQILRLQNVRYA